MRAAVLGAIGAPLTLDEVPEPVPGPGEVLVETKACGICGTDIHIQDGWGYSPDLPFVMGHEPSGLVVALGAGTSGVEIGQRVVPNIFYNCLACRYCLTGRETQCLKLGGILGVLGHRGGYGARFTIPARQVFPIPDVIPFAEAAIIADAVVTALHAVRSGRIAAGETVVVIGIGGCGGAAVQICAMEGAHVIAVDNQPAKRGQALRLGAEIALITGDQDVLGAVRELTAGLGADCVIDAVGSTATLALGVEALAPGGRLIVLGYTQERFRLDPRQVALRELEIRGVRSGGPAYTREAIRLVADPRWQSLVSDRYPIEQVNEALVRVRSGTAAGRVVLTFE